MKNFKAISLFILFASITTISIAQDKYFTREGFVSFHSDTEVEQIHEDIYKVTSILDTETGKLEFAVLMKAFEFEKALMEEHFNENYVESDKFPKAIFKGQISALEAVNWEQNGEYTVIVNGTLTIHGVSNEISEKGIITIHEKGIKATSSFMIMVSDYDISIPKVVIKNIAEEVKVDVKMDYQKFTKS